MTESQKLNWYQWAYIMMVEQPGNSVLVAEKLKSMGLPITSQEVKDQKAPPTYTEQC